MLKIKECKKFMKVCSKCGQLRTVNYFNIRKDSKDGYRNICRICSRGCHKIRKSKNKRIKCKCDYCGIELELVPYRYNRSEKHFCSKECQGKWNSKNLSGENSPTWQGGEMYYKCDYCGKESHCKKYHYNETKKHFCSNECRSKWWKETEEYKGKNSSNWQGGDIYYKCDYCGEESHCCKARYEANKHHFCSSECFGKWNSENKTGEANPMYGKRHTEESKQKISKNRKGKYKGENNPNWNPNLTQEEREHERTYTDYYYWRISVFERDNYTCQFCGDNKGHNLNAHHLNGYDWDKKNRTNVDNGITLCNKCHKTFHNIYGYGNNTKEQFMNFIENII